MLPNPRKSFKSLSSSSWYYSVDTLSVEEYHWKFNPDPCQLFTVLYRNCCGVSASHTVGPQTPSPRQYVPATFYGQTRWYSWSKPLAVQCSGNTVLHIFGGYCKYPWRYISSTCFAEGINISSLHRCPLMIPRHKVYNFTAAVSVGYL